MRLIGVLAGLGLLLGTLLFSAAPALAGDPCYHGFAMPALDEGDEPEIKMAPCAFSPAVVRVAPGTTVEWFNDQEEHLVTGANQEWGSRDISVAPRGTVAYRFDRPGTYPYACAIHRGMSGVVVVGDGMGVAGAGKAVVEVKAPNGRSAGSDAGSGGGVALAPRSAASPRIDPRANAALAASTAPAPVESAPTMPLVALAIAGVLALVTFAFARARTSGAARAQR